MLWQYGHISKPDLVIVGAGEFAEIAYEYFTHDSPYKVAGFAVERPFLVSTQLCGLPVIALDEVERHFPSSDYSAFVAVTYTKLNRIRARLFGHMRALGYPMASYVSSHAFVWRSASIGENVFIFEQNVVQHGTTLEDDVVLWSGNHVGHRSRLRAHCYLASHVVVSGYCTIGEHCFVGVNVTIADNVTIGPDCVLGAGSIILKDAPGESIYGSTMTERSPVSSLRFHRIRATS